MPVYLNSLKARTLVQISAARSGSVRFGRVRHSFRNEPIVARFGPIYQAVHMTLIWVTTGQTAARLSLL